MLQKNQVIPLRITALTGEGNGVGRHDGMAVFVPGTAPGDELDAKIVKVHKSYAYGIISALRAPGPGRVKNNCPVYGRCGGCSLRHIDYETELEAKAGWVRDNLRRIGGLQPEMQPIIPSPQSGRYRNKAQYPVRLVNGRVRAGFFARRSHDLIPVEDCLLQPRFFADICKLVCAFMEQHGIAPYDEKTGEGLVRHLYIRHAQAGGQTLVCLVINGAELPHADKLAKELRKACPTFTTLATNRNTKNTNVIFGERTAALYGPGWIEDEICGVKVRLSPTSFYQVNQPAAELLYKQAGEYVGSGGLLLDLYCGAGTIGLSMAARFDKIVGVETVAAAVRDAKINAKQNGIMNALFYEDDAANAAAKLLAARLHPDVVVLDPPRKGAGAETVRQVAAMKPATVVYVSCDSATLARDAALFGELGYRAERVRAVDLFPRTAHVESVLLLRREG